MQQWEREFHVARIVASKTRIKIDKTVLFFVAPTREQRYIASEVYRDARRDAELDGALTDDELLNLLVSQGIWTAKDADNQDKLNKALDDLKVGLYDNRMRSNARFSIRQALKKTKDEIIRLDGLRHGLDYVTIDGLAMSAKYRYLVGACLRYEDGSSYWQDGSWDKEDPFIDKAVEIITYDRINESQIRELARTDPWKTLWGVRSHAGRGIFDCSSVDLTDEQRNLVTWSTVFDNIREYPDCPADDIFEDDDMLDGWIITAKRKRESKQASQEANSIGNSKIRDAAEIFVVADTIEDARKIDKMNDVSGSMTKAQRMSFLKQKGEVNEVNMPDTTQRISMELARLESMKIRQGK